MIAVGWLGGGGCCPRCYLLEGVAVWVLVVLLMGGNYSDLFYALEGI